MHKCNLMGILFSSSTWRLPNFLISWFFSLRILEAFVTLTRCSWAAEWVANRNLGFECLVADAVVNDTERFLQQARAVPSWYSTATASLPGESCLKRWRQAQFWGATDSWGAKMKTPLARLSIWSLHGSEKFAGLQLQPFHDKFGPFNTWLLA